MKAILKRDLIIKAGTVFEDAPLTRRFLGDHVECVRGIGKGSYASVVIDLDKDSKKSWGKYFTVVKGKKECTK